MKPTKVRRGRAGPPRPTFAINGNEFVNGTYLMAGLDGEWHGPLPPDFEIAMVDAPEPIEITIKFYAWLDWQINMPDVGLTRAVFRWRRA